MPTLEKKSDISMLSCNRKQFMWPKHQSRLRYKTGF